MQMTKHFWAACWEAATHFHPKLSKTKEGICTSGHFRMEIEAKKDDFLVDW
jgi:hypothetical protein